uniref:Retrotrans_gag domain-containing protein n=1 Tax=Schistosoma curassoni TaxID=6186 RepID=A0A183KQ67_9TREM
LATANDFAACNTLPQNWRLLDDCLTEPVDTQQVTIRFLSRHQKANESLIAYLNSLQQIVVQALPGLDIVGQEELVRSRFVKGLGPGPLREHILRSPPIDTPELKRTTLRFLVEDKLANLSDAQPPSVMTVEGVTESSGPDSFQAKWLLPTFPAVVPAAGSQVRDGIDDRHGTTTMGVKPNVYIARGLTGMPGDAVITSPVNQVSGVFAIYLRQPRINALEEEEQALRALDLQDDS